MKTLFATIALAIGTLFNTLQQDFSALANSWTEGFLAENDSIIPARPSRGGSRWLTFNEDGTASVGDPFNCGFGIKREGTWKLNKKDSLITVHLTREVGYMMNEQNKNIDITEKYKVIRLTPGTMLLHMLDDDGNMSRELAYIRAEEH